MTTDLVEALFAGDQYDDAPGAMLAVVDSTGVAWQRSVGRALLHEGGPFDGATRFRLCSISKAMAAQAIIGLAAAGKLELDAPARDYLPELRALPRGPTIAQLMSMQSGIREYISLAHFATGLQSFPASTQQFLELLLRQRDGNFSPGSATLYSNSNYLLLQTIIERVSAAPINDALQRYVFGPSGMRDAALVAGPVRHERAMACAYERLGDAWRPFEYLAELDVCGGIIASFDDVVAWLRWTGLENLAAQARLTTSPMRSDGSVGNYALGFQVQSLSGRRLFGHSGGIGPWATDALWLPESQCGVLVLANRNDINWYERSREIAVRWLGLDPDPGATPRLIRANPPAHAWTAQYANEQLGVSYRVAGSPEEWCIEERRFGRDAHGRFIRTLGVEPVFVTPGADSTSGGPPAEITYQHGNEPWACRLASPSNEHAAAACGWYSSPELPGHWHIAPGAGGELQLKYGIEWPAGPAVELHSVTARLWRGQRQAKDLDLHVWLVLEGSAVTAIEVSDARVRRLRLHRRIEPGAQ